MKKTIVTLILMLSMLPLIANAYEQLADGVYKDGSTLYIGSGVTSLGNLQVNPSVIYCYATIPPACVANTFTGYGGTLHVPTSAMVNYFSAQYWYNFTNVMADAVEPTALNLSHESVTIITGDQFHISASVIPTNSTPNTVSWYSTNTAVATISGGTVTTVAPGECDIVANCAALQAVCHVIATSARVTISLDKHVARVLPNHMLTLTATCSPTPTDLTVMSSDNTIAIPRLVNGVIQVLGIKEGTATITVGSFDGTANTDACLVTVYTELGDVNADGFVDVSDVTTLISRVLGNETLGFNEFKADVNHDNQLDVSDVTMLISFILSGLWPWSPPHDADWVDLGLPSGTLWATMNVGASSPEDYGDYFAWGEIEPKESYLWSTYKWCNGSDNTLTKYCTDSNYGTVDNKTELDLEDDAAYMNWGSSWRMPTTEQQKELVMNCNWTWTTSNGVNGYLVTGPNGSTLFLPAVGSRWYTNINGTGECGYYWASTLFPGYSNDAHDLDFIMTGVFYYVNHTRDAGHAVRAVRISQN